MREASNTTVNGRQKRYSYDDREGRNSETGERCGSLSQVTLLDAQRYDVRILVLALVRKLFRSALGPWLLERLLGARGARHEVLRADEQALFTGPFVV